MPNNTAAILCWLRSAQACHGRTSRPPRLLRRRAPGLHGRPGGGPWGSSPESPGSSFFQIFFTQSHCLVIVVKRPLRGLIGLAVARSEAYRVVLGPKMWCFFVDSPCMLSILLIMSGRQGNAEVRPQSLTPCEHVAWSVDSFRSVDRLTRTWFLLFNRGL